MWSINGFGSMNNTINDNLHNNVSFSRKMSEYALLLLAVIFVFALIVPVSSAASIQQFSMDGKTYSPGESILVSGEVVGGNDSGDVKIIIWPRGSEFTGISYQTNNKTVAASNGLFSTTIEIPADTASGEYTLVAVDIDYGSESPYLYFDVVGADDPKTIEIMLTEGLVKTVSLSSDYSTHNINGPLNASKTGGNVSFDDKTYYFLVSSDNVAYMDDDSDMDLSSDSSGNSVVGNLVEGSKVKLNTTTYVLTHIHNDSEIVLVRPIVPSFNGGETVNVTLLALNASTVPLNTSLTLEYFADDGTLLSSSTLTSGNDGLVTTGITVESNSGVYHLVANGIGHMSFAVNTVDMFGDILSEENKPKHTFARGENLVAAVFLKNIATGAPISDATSVTAKLTSATNASISQTLTLTYDSSISAYTCTYPIPSGAAIDTYNVEYTAVVGSQTQKAYTSYNIKTYDLFLKAVSKEKGESDGFAPGSEGFLIVAGTNLSSGDKLNIEEVLGVLDVNRFKLNITDNTGAHVGTTWSVMNLSTLFTYLSVPTDVQSEIKKDLGENLTIINFTAPSTNGVYDVLVQTNLTSDWTKVKTSIVVQDLFVHGEPVNKMGWFSPTVAPDAFARLSIMAFDPSDGSMLDASKINDAGLIEVWSESASDVVTEYMLNVTLETINDPFMGDTKVLKFQVNDSYLGFHHVKFWVNATVGGTDKIIMGDGWFDEKLYTIRAKPSSDASSGMYKVFGSTDDISLDVHVKDASNNNVSSATIEIETVKYGMTGETVLIDSDADSFNSSTTDSNGRVTITFNPTNSLKSGFYNVRIKMTTQDGVTDYGNGWFEVSNFIFFPYTTSWEAGLDQPINFTFNAFDSNFSNKNVSVTLTKIISMGDWEMMTPPSMYNETTVQVGYINGTGYYEHPGVSKGGNYEFVFEATDGSSTEVGRAWVHVTPFVTWVNSNHQYEYPVDAFVNVTVEGFEDGWDGTAHNITNVSVEKVMQEGMWMTTYRSKTQMADPLASTTENGAQMNQINLSINTSDWGQGGYSMILKVTDNQSNEVYTNFWFKLQLASVTVPDPMRVTISGGQYYTNTTSINATTNIQDKIDEFAGVDQARLGNVSAGKVSGMIGNTGPLTMNVDLSNQIVDMSDYYNVTFITMLVVDTVQSTVYIEYLNATGDDQFYNLSNDVTTQVFNASAGDQFTDYTGRTWEITEVTADGTVKLMGVNTLKNGLIVDSSVMSMSKSGQFLMGQIWDDEWRNIDLDGDGKYFGHDEKYHILMIDAVTAGKYDTVYISNVSNFSTGTYIDASSGAPIAFGGAPIYLLSNKYQSGAYNLEFTTYQKGWPGMHMGTYANGSILKIPFLVMSPDGTPVSGSKVTIDFLMDEGRNKEYLPVGVNNTTDSKGLAIITINTTETPIKTGAWMIHYNATINGNYAVADEEMFWEMPRFELRNFMVSGALGIPGSIDLLQISDSDTGDGKPGENMLLGYGDEFEFKRGVGMWLSWDGLNYTLEYPFDDWMYNVTLDTFLYTPDNGANYYPIGNTSINSSRSKNVVTYGVISINMTGDNIVLTDGTTTSFYDDMWMFNVTNIAADNGSTTIAISYKGWPWTMPDSKDPGAQPAAHTFNLNDNCWFGGLDFRVTTINSSNNTVILELNNPVMVASVEALSILMDGNDSNGEADKMRGSVNTVNFSGQEYIVYGYEDKANTSRDLVEHGWIETMDRVLVENVSNGGETNIYRVGENITEFNGYYAASVSEWGGKIVLLNSSVTQVFPIPQWGSDAPIYYVGTFSDADLGVDLATLGMGGGPDMPEGNITSDDRYSMLMFDSLPNGVNYPSQAIYDDDPDLTELGVWETWTFYDMFGVEMGYGDAIKQSDGQMNPDNLQYTNMSEQSAWDVGTGNMESWPMAIPKITINDSTKTAVAKTFAPLMDIEYGANITIYVTAKDFEGTPISGTASLTSIKVMFGGTFEYGPADDLPKTWDMTSSLINVTLVDGEGLLKVTPDDLPDDMDYDFAEYTTVLTIEKDSGGTETLKVNFFMMDEDNMPEFDGPKDDSMPK